jgi:muramoyltetrapeptide carboxypeptidase
MAIYTKTGLVGFHGPIAQQNFSQYTLAEFKKILMHPSASSVIGAAPIFDATEGQVEKENRLTRIAGGIASGRLVGGNLTLVCSLIGTEYEPDFRDKILFLEDVGEAPYRIDRLLTQLWLAGKLQQVAGIAFGKFTETTTTGNTFSVEEVIRDRCAGLGVPVVLGFMIGHVNDQTVVPIGIKAELDGDQGKLSLLEAAVV